MELSKTKLGVYASLDSVRMRRKHGLWLAEGEKLVADTRGAFMAEALVVTPRWLEANPGVLGFEPESVRTATPDVMKRLSNMMTPPEVVAVYRLPDEPEPSAVIFPSDRLVLMLDGVRDPGNLGTIVRTADWFGVYDIVASPDCADIFNPKTVQATMGAVSRVRISYLPLAEVIAANPGMPVYGTLLEGADIYAAHLTPGGFIIMGNEGQGISPAVRGLIGRPLYIPPYGGGGHGESLNVAAATAVTVAEFRRRASDPAGRQ
ncbi:MAG: RNA methyltransferase [Muribaculaceae bacterium]|nr:RNA methyltransferase [Muribaculaceae bacterium]